uniref:MYND-type domain-containing protein n=1 Tax=Ditylum brightwellii TaxID=49249 RepID=A0A6U3SHC0_9STRA|mmetsp:Transcript_32189/g.48003  ORF Transcript_32189/g.48003 Transcript_32189/m.48003 type:complete len:322 (+) Transcript_32189:33-998(+)
MTDEITLPLAEVAVVRPPLATVTPIAELKTTTSTAEEDEILPVATLLCSNKGCDNEGKKRCSRCKFTYYCSTGCQKADWKDGHKKICSSSSGSSRKVRASSSSQTRSPPTMGCDASATASENGNNQQPSPQTENGGNDPKKTKIIPIQVRRMAQAAAKKLVAALRKNEYPDKDTSEIFGIQQTTTAINDNVQSSKKEIESISTGVLIYHSWVEVYKHRLSHSINATPTLLGTPCPLARPQQKQREEEASKIFTIDVAASLAGGKLSQLFEESVKYVIECNTCHDTISKVYCIEMKLRGFGSKNYLNSDDEKHVCQMNNFLK